jgi:hypothetical protein
VVYFVFFFFWRWGWWWQWWRGGPGRWKWEDGEVADGVYGVWPFGACGLLSALVRGIGWYWLSDGGLFVYLYGSCSCYDPELRKV